MPETPVFSFKNKEPVQNKPEKKKKKKTCQAHINQKRARLVILISDKINILVKNCHKRPPPKKDFI